MVVARIRSGLAGVGVGVAVACGAGVVGVVAVPHPTTITIMAIISSAKKLRRDLKIFFISLFPPLIIYLNKL